MNGSNGYSPANYGAPPPQSQGYGPPQGYSASPSQPPAYGAAPSQPPAYGAPPAQNGYGAPPQQGAYGAPSQGAYGVPPQQQQQQGYSPYGAAPQAYGAAPFGYAQQGMPGMMSANAAPKSTGLAVALELLGGFFFQTFGVGHLYAGNVGVGLGLMFGYWLLTALNFALCFVFVGFITWPLTWLAFMIISGITANNAAKRFNAKASGQPQL